MGRDAILGNVLNGLVAKGTLTTSQVDAIQKSLKDSMSSMKSEVKVMKDAYLKVITDTLGISESDLLSRIKAGESLAAIAGAKKDVLISAIVAFHSKNVEATQLKANLQDRITAEVNRAKGLGKMKGLEFMGGRGHGKGPRP
jgi:hypothetical protein